jgi:cytochrome c
MKRILLVFGLCVAMAFGVAAVGSAADGKALFARCTGCHGADGMKTTFSKPLKGQKAEAIAKALEGYKAKTYGGEKKSMMEGQAAALSPEDIKALAAFIPTL